MPDEAYARFTENLAELLATWHLPRATGKVYAVLLLAEEATTLEALREATGLSAGQVSTSVRELTSWGLARTWTGRGTRRLYVQAESGLETLLEASHRRARLFIDALRAGEELVAPASAASDRLNDIVALFDGYVAAGEQILAGRRPRAVRSDHGTKQER
ncbi:GbsR/MarR family transcriptional regulator [Puerhibacterium puerhi]|uniref:GbsR/MarR family transcriptional regulator n=1 Tax=Puerhibacterium puerhi TaxID=2692623 RepID=UPI00135BECED|nr:transcriptional regulator [Puerhibacterium puerhi]